MSVYRAAGKRAFRYDFWWRGHRYRGTTGQLRREDALLYEQRYKLQLRREAGGVAPLEAHRTPRLQDWAEIYYREASLRVTRPDRLAHLIRSVLRFWGVRPADPGKVQMGAPYHHLHLADPILNPSWILQFEAWMDVRRVQGRPLAGQTRNQYRSVLSQMYQLALTPAWRQKSGVTVNPFRGVPRDRQRIRTVTLTVPELRRWIAAASYHVRLAVAIAALAPKLRLGNILRLQWGTHLDPEFRWITVHDHKTAARTGRPLVVPIVEQLRDILRDARTRTRGPYVVAYQGRPVKTIRDGLEGAARRSGLAYGRRCDGVTFHTVRHTIATMLAERADIQEGMRKELMGHGSLQTTQGYTHIRPVTQVPPLEALSQDLPLRDLVTDPRRRARQTLIGNFGGRRPGR